MFTPENEKLARLQEGKRAAILAAMNNRNRSALEDGVREWDPDWDEFTGLPGAQLSGGGIC